MNRMTALLIPILSLILQSSYASPFVHARATHDLPGNWTAQGCWTDSVTSRTLVATTFSNLQNMTTEACVDFCDTRTFVFAGTEFGQECYCANFTSVDATLSNDTDCAVPCVGDATETCGGEFFLDLFWSGVTPPVPATVPSVGDWVSLGCFSDNVDGRALTIGPLSLDTPTTIEACTDECFSLGYQFSGAEFAAECYCGTSIQNGGAEVPLTDCNIACAGNASEFCGSGNRLNVYNYTGTDLPPIAGGGDNGGGGSTPVPPAPVLSGLPTTWAYVSCFVDGAFGRVFEAVGPASPNNTIESCIAACDSRNFTVAGTEFADECYCGNRLVNGAVAADETSCSMGCAGNATEACGGPNRVSVYSSGANLTVLPVPTPATTGLPDGWAYDGCFTDLGGNDDRALPHQIILTGNDSAVACIDACTAVNVNFTAAGMEFGDECYCGVIEDLTTNNSTQTAENECNVACSGDAATLCGGGFRLQVYTFTTDPGTGDDE